MEPQSREDTCANQLAPFGSTIKPKTSPKVTKRVISFEVMETAPKAPVKDGGIPNNMSINQGKDKPTKSLTSTKGSISKFIAKFGQRKAKTTDVTFLASMEVTKAVVTSKPVPKIFSTTMKVIKAKMAEETSIRLEPAGTTEEGPATAVWTLTTVTKIIETMTMTDIDRRTSKSTKKKEGRQSKDTMRWIENMNNKRAQLNIGGGSDQEVMITTTTPKLIGKHQR